MPEEILETPQPTQPTEQESTNWTKIILAAVLGLGLLAAAAYAGYYYGTQQIQPVTETTPVVSQPIPTPTPTPAPTPTSTPPIEGKTEDSKTYERADLGFSIDYPNSLGVIDDTAAYKSYLQEVDERCEREGGCGGGPRASWIISFVSVSDKEKMAAESPDFLDRPYQFRLSIFEGITIHALYGEKAPAGYFQHMTDYLMGGKMGLKQIQKGDPLYGQNPYLLYGVDNKDKTYSLMFPNRTDSAQDLEYTEKIVSTFKFL